MRIFLASSNGGKLREYRELSSGSALDLGLLPNFSQLPLFEETASTFAENATGKALYYSRVTTEIVIADDSGLVVPALGGSPGVLSARYGGPNATSAECVAKLLQEMKGKEGSERRARFVCVIAVAKRGRIIAVTSDFAEGSVAHAPSGANGFGYDPIFRFGENAYTWAETSAAEKNQQSHRGKAFRKIVKLLSSADCGSLS
jgi:XTP/dITP diphosphohydrolase